MIPLNSIIPSGIEMLLGAESAVGRRLVEQVSTARGETIHGFGHTARVIFWTGCLTALCNQAGYPVPAQDGTAGLYAAFFHDLARHHDGWDEAHGRRAAQRFEGYLRSRLSPDQFERCTWAITWHSRSHIPPTTDPVALLLKDADALDRGRLNRPERGEGVSLRRLSLPALRNDPLQAESAAWAAYRLAQNTLALPWGKDPCGELARAISSMDHWANGSLADWVGPAGRQS